MRLKDKIIVITGAASGFGKGIAKKFSDEGARLILVDINLNLLKKGGKTLVGTHDFSTFRASTCTAKSAIKKMNSIVIKKNHNKIILTFKSKSFLQNQVRSMVGCLEKLSSSEWSLKKFKEVLKSKKRTNCAPPAPAYGLYLKNVRY